MSFNWHKLDRNNILGWAVTHSLSTKQITEAHERGENWEDVTIETTINGMKVDGEKLILDMWAMLNGQFEIAIDEAIDKRFRESEMAIEDVMTEVFERAKAKLKGEEYYG